MSHFNVGFSMKNEAIFKLYIIQFEWRLKYDSHATAQHRTLKKAEPKRFEDDAVKWRKREYTGYFICIANSM